jgi:preprotein translocase subunit SecG
MQTLLTIFHVLLSIGLITLVLLQHGKGADAGAAFGGGASATVFGAGGAGNFLSRTTAILATLFFMTSIGLAFYATQAGKERSLMDQQGASEAVPAPRAAPDEVPQAPVEPAELAVPTPDDLPPAVSAPEAGAGSESDVPTISIDDVPVPTGD